MAPDERRAHAQVMFARHPKLFPADRRPFILDGVVSLGMSPYEAHLAAGAFKYKVILDKNRWPAHTDPLEAMWAQSLSADDSEICMTFDNPSQFPGEASTVFRVYFERGKANKIEKVAE
ncbi:hypothetical protein [Pseudoduganella violacea]|uniref:Uncharacterized protein n=1 Tax=Pseudoduganella violacea TaxID=1715466 RepID=A0A7W5BFR2_9BURK|nr:hypothetical protein [Pseudoduganella violacea]MBB3122327.1 hypothetical protein [Pseudoduganella violacea]